MVLLIFKIKRSEWVRESQSSLKQRGRSGQWIPLALSAMVLGGKNGHIDHPRSFS
jgi:hypothetical protein